jgi:hypothetical protein
VLKLQDRRSDVGGNADAKLGSGRMAARATARSRSCGSPDFGLVRWTKDLEPRRWGKEYRHQGVCFWRFGTLRLGTSMPSKDRKCNAYLRSSDALYHTRGRPLRTGYQTWIGIITQCRIRIQYTARSQSCICIWIHISRVHY